MAIWGIRKKTGSSKSSCRYFQNIYMRTYALPSATRVFSSEPKCLFGEIKSLNLKLCPTLPLSCHSKKLLFQVV
jgi:hypothetical protein